MNWSRLARESGWLRFGGSSPPPPPPPPPPLEDTSAREADAAASEARQRAQKRRGRSKTILTSPTGAPLGDTMFGGQPTLGA